MPFLAGNCFHAQSISTQRFHLWVLLNDPDGDDGGIALVNFTEDTGIDSTVVLYPAENWHPFITKPTIIEYSRPLLIRASVLAHAIASGKANQDRADCPPELLAVIRAGVFKSRHAPGKLKRFCEGLF